MYIHYNENPKNRLVGDCVVRAISVALNVDWDTAYCLVTAVGFGIKNMPSANDVWGVLLERNGFRRKSIPNTCPNCYTAEDFCREHPRGTYVLGFGTHVATVVDGGLLVDAWDSSQESVQYYWERK